MADHHNPLANDNVAAQLVHLADFICNQHDIHHSPNSKFVAAVPEVWEELGLSESDLPGIVTDMYAGLAKADAILAAAAG